MTPACRKCSRPVQVAWQTFSNGTRHLRATCAECGFVGYLAQRTQDGRPSAAAQMASQEEQVLAWPVVPASLFDGSVACERCEEEIATDAVECLDGLWVCRSCARFYRGLTARAQKVGQ